MQLVAEQDHTSSSTEVPCAMQLVSASQIQCLLTDNIDTHVSDYIIFTTHGTLLTHSAAPSPQPPNHRPLSRREITKFCPFAGTIWRNHAKQILTTNMTHISIGSLPGSRTLGFKMKQIGALEGLSDEEGESEEEPEEENEKRKEAVEKGGNSETRKPVRKEAGNVKRNGERARYELEQLTLEIDGMISVLRLVTPRLLVAARLPRQDFRHEVDEVSQRIWSGEGDGLENGGSEDEEEADDGEYHEDCHEEIRSKVGKMRILELRCEGMAEALAADYPAKLPNDFY